MTLNDLIHTCPICRADNPNCALCKGSGYIPTSVGAAFIAHLVHHYPEILDYTGTERLGDWERIRRQESHSSTAPIEMDAPVPSPQRQNRRHAMDICSHWWKNVSQSRRHTASEKRFALLQR